jgi:hypothetical protein
VSGNDSGVWRVDDGKRWKHCTVVILDRDLLGMVSGKINPGEAYMQAEYASKAILI